MHLDKMKTASAIALMLSEEASVPRKLMRERKKIERVVHLIARVLKKGGRIFYVGAGTSGRLGVLDASECPPTFSTSPHQVQAIVAGGDAALRQAIEGAEDDYAAGRRAIEKPKVDAKDIVIGITASGTTPFVWGALAAAKKRRAATVLVCFNPHLIIPSGLRPRIIISPDLGPEVLTGSTRLKAGTATKLLLNMFTTLSMVRAGKVISNLMVDLRPTNIKLRDRATRIVMELARTSRERAHSALERNGWNIKKAVGRRSRK
jgi:N-acetylmuramic acid 6-phosphate etherase